PRRRARRAVASRAARRRGETAAPSRGGASLGMRGAESRGAPRRRGKGRVPERSVAEAQRRGEEIRTTRCEPPRRARANKRAHVLGPKAQQVFSLRLCVSATHFLAHVLVDERLLGRAPDRLVAEAQRRGEEIRSTRREPPRRAQAHVVGPKA